MNKYLIYIISASVYSIIIIISVYNFAIDKERNACIAKQSIYIANQIKVANKAIAKQTDAVTEAQSAIATATQERIVYKPQYIYVKGTESCANVCVDILKKGLE